jgi:DNA-binding NarL/FixJ family response regulator
VNVYPSSLRESTAIVLAVPCRVYIRAVAAPIRVLLADDSEMLRKAIRSLLSQDASIVLVGEATNYPELLKQLKETKPDVALIDIHMPGLREAASFSDELRQTCVLAISFWVDEETAKVAQNFGALRLLDKGQLVSTLIPAIHECAGHLAKDRPA